MTHKYQPVRLAQPELATQRSFPMFSYPEMYPPVSVGLLRDIYNTNKPAIDLIVRNNFAIGELINPITNRANAVSVSLFAPVVDVDKKGLAAPGVSGSSDWSKRYFYPFLANLERFAEFFDIGRWKLIVYLCPISLRPHVPMAGLISRLLSYGFIEVRMMKYASTGLSPGTLWRFLALGDVSLDKMLVFDVDESWSNWFNTWHNLAARYGAPLTRAVHLPRENFWLSPAKPWFLVPDGSIRNYPTMLASKILARPRGLGIPDISVLMSAYIWLRQSRARSRNPFAQLYDEEPLTPYNHPVADHCWGFGNHWNHYCFDERFLKHVLYPYAVNAGSLCTYCIPQNVTGDLVGYFNEHRLHDFVADFRYTQRHAGNIIVNNGEIVVQRF